MAKDLTGLLDKGLFEQLKKNQSKRYKETKNKYKTKGDTNEPSICFFESVTCFFCGKCCGLWHTCTQTPIIT